MLPARRIDPDLLAARSGDPEAWRSVLKQHGPRVWTLCRRLCHEPEDAYQEVWERVHRSLDRFDPARGSFEAWLTTIAHRHLIDRHRRRRVRGEVLPLPDLRDPGPDPVAALSRRDRIRQVERALAALPEPARRVVVLHHLHDTPLAEIAAVEGVAVGTVKSRLHRARARLAEILLGSTP